MTSCPQSSYAILGTKVIFPLEKEQLVLRLLNPLWSPLLACTPHAVKACAHLHINCTPFHTITKGQAELWLTREA